MTNDDLSGWDYEFRAWRKTSGFDPVSLIASIDESGSYEMDRRHVFLCKNGSFAVVDEQGCSCYDCNDASIDFHLTKADALEAARIPPTA